MHRDNCYLDFVGDNEYEPTGSRVYKKESDYVLRVELKIVGKKRRILKSERKRSKSKKLRDLLKVKVNHQISLDTKTNKKSPEISIDLT